VRRSAGPTLDQSCLKVGGHPRLAVKHGLKPERRRVPCDRLAEPATLSSRICDGVAQFLLGKDSRGTGVSRRLPLI